MCCDLTQTPLFQGIDPQELDSLLQCLGTRRRSFRRGETILQEGQPTEVIGVVLSGMAVMEYQDFQGVNSVLGSAHPGMVFGEAYACIPSEPLLISVRAAEDTEVLFLNVGRVLTTCPNSCGFHARLVRNLLTVCAAKNLELSRRALHTTSKTIRGRLLSYFSECAKRAGQDCFTLPYNRQQLADYLNLDRSALCSELSKMQRDGLLRYQKNQITLLHRAAGAEVPKI